MEPVLLLVTLIKIKSIKQAHNAKSFLKAAITKHLCREKLTRWRSELLETNSYFKTCREKMLSHLMKNSSFLVFGRKLNSPPKNILTYKKNHDVVKKHM